MDLIHILVITAAFILCISSQTLSSNGVNVCTTSIIIRKCCPGWKQQGAGCPVAICLPPCQNGICSTPNKCNCDPGYTGSYCEKDINECNTLKPCQQICTNIPGSYACSCQTGYRKIGQSVTSSKCEDINECDTLKPCQQICTNKPGSYACSCQTGYRKIGQSVTSSKCEDINECDTLKPCQQNCTNIPGSYACSCRTGYRKIGQSVTSSKCEAVCSSCVHGVCVQPEVCECFEGFELKNCSKGCDDGFYGRNCTNRCHCKNNAKCDPKNGSCTCTAGWQGNFCEMKCIQGWGLGCKNQFTCEMNNTIFKNPVNGECICAPGYTGRNCESNCPKWSYGDKCLNECACVKNNTETCDKVDGNCDCFIGWNGTRCQDPHCEDWRYGIRCDNTCSCIQNNTESCDARTGECICKTGWISSTCNIQVEIRSKGQSEDLWKEPYIYGLVGGGLVLIFIVVGVIVARKRKNSSVNKTNSHATAFKSFSEDVIMSKKKSLNTKTKSSLERNDENDYIDNHISFVTGCGDDYIEFHNTRLDSDHPQSHLVANEQQEQPVYGNMPAKRDVRELIYENTQNVNVFDNNMVENDDHYMSYGKDISEDDTYMPLNKTKQDETYEEFTYDQKNQDETLTKPHVTLPNEPEIGIDGEEYEESLYGNVISESALYGNVDISMLDIIKSTR